jgi:tetratricopeptide repeat protein 30
VHIESQYLYDYLDAVITHQTSPDDAYAKFDAIAAAMIDELRQLTKKVTGLAYLIIHQVPQVNDARAANNEEQLRLTVSDYDNALKRYIPVLMSQVRMRCE